MPACSQANIVPVRPKPVMISSAMRSTPCSSQISRARRRKCGWYMRMPLAPCTMGSRMRAAMLSDFSSMSFASVPAASMAQFSHWNSLLPAWRAGKGVTRLRRSRAE